MTDTDKLAELMRIIGPVDYPSYDGTSLRLMFDDGGYWLDRSCPGRVDYHYPSQPIDHCIAAALAIEPAKRFLGQATGNVVNTEYDATKADEWQWLCEIEVGAAARSFFGGSELDVLLAACRAVKEQGEAGKEQTSGR